MSFQGLSAGEFVLLFSSAALAAALITLLGFRLRATSVATALLWRRLLRQRRTTWRRILTLLLQLLIIFLLALAVADPRPRPGTARQARRLVLLVDTSASMAARQEDGSRLQLAVRLVRLLAGRARPQDDFLLLSFARELHWLYGPGPGGAELARAAGRLRTRLEHQDLAAALSAAGQLVSAGPGERRLHWVVISDGFHELPASAPKNLLQVSVGRPLDNLALTAFELLPLAGGGGLEARVGVSNFGRRQLAARLVIHTERVRLGQELLSLVPGQHLERRYRLAVPPRRRVMATLVDRNDGKLDAWPDDDRAYALAPLLRRRRVWLGGRRNFFLRVALSLQPGVELSPSAQGAQAAFLVGRCPPLELPAVYIDPPAVASCPFQTAGTVSSPRQLRANDRHFLSAGLDLDTLRVRRARHLQPRPGDQVLLADGNAPLFLARPGRRRQAALGIDLAGSDLPLRVAFPVLVSRLLEWLAGPAVQAAPPPLRLGDSVELPGDADRLEVRRPDGSTPDPAARGPGRRLRLDQPGFWTIDGPGRSRTLAVNLHQPGESNLAGDQLAGAGRVHFRPGQVPAALGRLLDGPPLRPAAPLWPRILLAAAWLLLIDWLAFCFRLLF
ncbi:MAG: hypothetical protein DRI34_03155 [Deltaproteobacteria bacterium]|nr:MAG: hypothetical protein DRI34_03155 [Deltaproteobacteria bacterium]